MTSKKRVIETKVETSAVLKAAIAAAEARRRLPSNAESLAAHVNRTARQRLRDDWTERFPPRSGRKR